MVAHTASDCNIARVGVDTSLATTTGDIILGKAWGETFVATDTLISTVTVWRIPPEHDDLTSTKFWITSVDSTGMPLTHAVAFDGPWLSVVSADSTRPTMITYEFDPPIALPSRGTYCFWIQVCTGYADLLIDGNAHYAGGQLWQTFRSDFDDCILRSFPRSLPDYDLVFTIEFCAKSTTQARRGSWGKLKSLYR